MAFFKDDHKKFESGFELKMVEEDKDLECSICLHMLKEAMGTPCSHVFCRGCIQKLISKEDKVVTTFDCPECQQQVNTENVYPNTFLDRKVGGSNVYCLQRTEGCDWIGTLASFFQKHKNECKFRMVPCVHGGCTFSGIKIKMKDHESNCEHRMIPCEHCQANFKVNMLEEHYGSCERIPILCPEKECDVFVPLIEMHKHLDEDCMFVKVSCSFAKFGCLEKVSKKDLNQHYEISTKQHMALMCESIFESQSQIKDLKKDKEEMQNENNNLKIEVQRLSTKVSTLTQFCPDFEVRELLLQGVEKWIKKSKKAVLEESYATWFKNILHSMVKDKLYMFDKAMFMKLKIGKRDIYWYSNDKDGQKEACRATDIYHRGDNLYLLRKRSNEFIINTETLDNFDCYNSNLHVFHPFLLEKITYTYGNKHERYDSWLTFSKLDELTDDFFVNGFGVVALVKG